MNDAIALDLLPAPPPRSFLKETGGVICSILGRQILDLGHVHQLQDGSLVWYEGGVYRADGERCARKAITDALGSHYKAEHLNGTLTWLRAQAPLFPELPPDDRINCANGLLDWRSTKPTLYPHTPEFKSLVQVPIAWNQDADCPGIRGFLKRVWPPDAFDLFFEWSGYLLLPRLPFKQAAMQLAGSGDNGKSVVIKIQTALVGEQNTANHSIQFLSDSRFACADLQGRLLNACGDLDAKSIHRSDLFKKITGGDRIPGERKFRDAFMFQPFAKLLFSVNEAPYSRDQTDAWFARWIVIDMNQVIPPEEQDPFLVQKLTTREELDGYLVWAVEGLRLLVERGRFVLPASVEAARDDYREKLDTVVCFVNDGCELKPDARLSRTVVYQRYRMFCDGEGRLPVSATVFYDRLSRLHPERVRLTMIGGRRLVIGLGLLPLQQEGWESTGRSRWSR